MLVKDIFKRDIGRTIDGVIKVDESEDIKNELEEYVVTKKIDEYIRNFFSLIQAIDSNKESNTGVWISGYYGSGKSHFLKILSKILDNKEYSGKRPIEYLQEQLNTFDYSLYNNIVQGNIETILFNIDAEAKNMVETESKLISAYMTVFYKHLGYTARDFNVVKVEQAIDRLGKLDEFKQKTKDALGKDYDIIMKSMDLYAEDIAEVFSELSGQSKEAAFNFILSKPAPKSISDFVQEVKEYVDKQKIRL